MLINRKMIRLWWLIIHSLPSVTSYHYTYVAYTPCLLSREIYPAKKAEIIMGIFHYSIDILMTKNQFKKINHEYVRKWLCHYGSKWSSSNLSRNVLKVCLVLIAWSTLLSVAKTHSYSCFKGRRRNACAAAVESLSWRHNRLSSAAARRSRLGVA